MVTGQGTVISEQVVKNRTTKRIRRTAQTPWKLDDNIYIAWNQEPIGVPKRPSGGRGGLC